MLRSIESFKSYVIGAKDDELGKVNDFLFDDISWTIRYVVADTGTWLPGRKVLIAVSALSQPDWQGRTLPVDLTREQVKNSPDIDTDKPVSRQHEIELHQYYNWAPYWAGGYEAVAMPAPPPGKPEAESTKQEVKGDPDLRSAREVTGYHIHATDGEIGHIEDFIISDENWIIRYMVVDTRDWLPGRRVLISPQWVTEISWEKSQVYVDITRRAVKESPDYDPTEPVNREYETRLYDYYGRPKYWIGSVQL